MSEELRSLISSAMTELDPEVDNQPQVEDDPEAITDSEYEVENTPEEESKDETEDAEDVSDDEEADEDPSADGEVFAVKVNGEVLEVSLQELKSGYQRQADYTREKQALKRQVEEFEEVKEELVGAFEGVQALEAAWEENPITVLAQFANNTENPTYAVALLIKELAPVLDRDFLEMFGVTPEVQRQWAQETKVNTVTREQQQNGSKKEQELAAAQEELEIQRAIVEYERQIDELLEEEGLDLTVKQRNVFRKELANYAAENELTNLKSAYKAFKYEESKRTKAVAAKTAQKAKEKKAASVVTRSGAGAEGSSAMKDNSDLQSVIRAAMKDTQGNLS